MAGEGDGGDDAAAAEERERVRLENERLRVENLRLRAAVASQAPPPEICVATPRGGTVDAADELVQLMREGGNLLKEREGLMAENSVLQQELGDLVEDFVPSVDGLEGVDLEAEIDRVVSKDETDLEALERLLPLLNEGDALCAEREGLRAEHQELVTTLEALGTHQAVGEVPLEDLLEVEAVDSGDLQARLRRAMEDVKRENTSLQGDVKRLRDDNARLRVDRANALATAAAETQAAERLRPPPPISIQPASPKIRKQMQLMMHQINTPNGKEEALMAELTAPETEDERQEAQRTAMAHLLRRHMAEEKDSPRPRVAPLKVPELPDERRSRKTQEPSEIANVALKSALHDLFRNFAR